MSIEEQIRQQKVATRRKDSGFKTKKCHFFDLDLLRLKKLAKKMGYEEKISNEDLTSIIRSCIAEKYSAVYPEKIIKIPNSKEEQYLYELKQIIAFRCKNHSTLDEIVQFMKNSKYPVPVDKYNSLNMSNDQPEWCHELVNALKPKK
ncbi:hypothetical protein [Photobacterium leiognathi]|uniref:hypothetical protein n=1 Tax=Photobacterium leiognathi TaxID=553611 RepID=UPI0029817366|nr:hypothetical protein [Photobacterium leiognathi]